MQLIRHIVFMRWRRDVTQQQINDWIETCNRMSEECPMLYNWYSGRAVAGPDSNSPVTHDFCASMDFRSLEEYAQFDEQPYHQSVYREAGKVVDIDSVANMNMLVEAEPLRAKS